MQRFILFSCVCFLSGGIFIACQRGGTVQAGSENDVYQPRPAPTIVNREVKGELVRVDSAAKTIQVRLENGMLQTFRFDDKTIVEGLSKKPQTKSAKAAANNSKVRTLVGKEGSEVTIHWTHDEIKTATNVEVTEVNNSRRSGRR